jgi:hypothetical protein
MNSITFGYRGTPSSEYAKSFVKELGGQYQELLKGASYPSGEIKAPYLCMLLPIQVKFNNNGNSPDEVDAGIDTSEHSDEEGLESDDDMEDSVYYSN